MERTKKSRGSVDESGGRPAFTSEARENQMISYAVNLAEQQLRDGTASSQVITHYLKLGTQRAKLEQEILESQKALLEAKTRSIESGERIEKLYADAISAMRSYSPSSKDDVL